MEEINKKLRKKRVTYKVVAEGHAGSEFLASNSASKNAVSVGRLRAWGFRELTNKDGNPNFAYGIFFRRLGDPEEQVEHEMIVPDELNQDEARREEKDHL